MSHEPDHYSENITEHPVRVYAHSPDLCLAYCMSKDDETIISRALVWKDKEFYGRIYGDVKRMEAAFETLGYTHDTLAGARLPHRDDDQMMPYVDYCPSGIVDDDGYIVMQSKVSYDSRWLYLQGTNGTFIDTQLCEYSKKWNFGEHFQVHTRNGVQSWSSNSRYDYAREIVNRDGNYEIWANTDLDRNGFPIQQEEAA